MYIVSVLALLCFLQIDSICGLKPFLALGKLDLSGNSLDWPELVHIRHMAIVDLTLCGNPLLESQPWCKYDHSHACIS